MKLKSYFAATVEAAIALARQELGPDAMLVHSKKTSAEARKLGEYEVVFAGGTEPSASPTQPPAALNRLADDICSMRRQIERMATALGSVTAAQASAPLAQPEAAQAFAALIRAGVLPEIAREFALRASSPADIQRIVSESVPIDTWELHGPALPRIAAFIGPPGAGKTTAIAKAAVAYGLARRASTIVLTCDVNRIAAAEQLRTLCSILGVNFQAVETAAGLEEACRENRQTDLILIDTAATSQEDPAGNFAPFLASRPDVEKHLVLPASMKQQDMSRIADEHRRWAYTHLIFSRMDETSTFGCILNETHRTGRPVSFLSWGQDIPEGLEPADPCRLAGIILGSEYARPDATEAAA